VTDGHAAPLPGNRFNALLRGVEDRPALDKIAGPAVTLVARALDPRPKNLLTGSWFGHPLHPVLTDFADGAWMAASFLDLFGPQGAAPAAQRLVGFGLLAAVPTAATGAAEWLDTDERERRVGLLHMATSTTAFVLYGWSYLARRRGRRRRGVVAGVIGGLVALADGYVGGHLSLARGVGVGHTVFSRRPDTWTPVDVDAQLPDGQPVRTVVDRTDIVVVRSGGRLFALENRCSYRGGELHRGEVSGEAIRCVEHGCTFRLADGAVLAGPASIPQPCLAVRLADGRVEVRDATSRRIG
jgi:nitrite reductase/ring-hydroxylating ferredoxin subunit/uncharacterized membrane protein